ncbi:GT-D fold domain-containing glycosyltransferase [Planctomycetota bacterium]
MILKKIKKELGRLNKRLFHSGKKDKELDLVRCKLDNLPYELYDKMLKDEFQVPMPIVKSIEDTLERILHDGCSLTRFGDGEFGMIFGSRICYHDRSPELAERLKEVVSSDLPNLLVGLPPCFGSLNGFIEPTINFWRKWMSKKREMVYSVLEMDHVYYNAFFNRYYLNYEKTEEHYKKCGSFFERMKEVWKNRDLVLFESQQAQLGVDDGFFDGAKSISRIIFCPEKNAFDRYDEILSAFDGVCSDTLILIALGPTATVLAYDLCKKGYQVIDIGMIAKEYECFLKKDVQYSLSRQIKDPEYEKQILKKIS